MASCKENDSELWFGAVGGVRRMSSALMQDREGTPSAEPSSLSAFLRHARAQCGLVPRVCVCASSN